MSGPPTFIEATWLAPPGVRALSSLRAAGNLAAHVGDDPAVFAANRSRFAAAVDLPHPPRWLMQVHGVIVADLDQPAPPVEADAAISASRGVVCAVLTADCLPLLLSAVDGSIVGAAHAGWRGLAAGVIEATVAAMRARMHAPVALQAWLGPAISAAHYEVGADVRDSFLARDPTAEPAFLANLRGRWQCDLYALARQRLDRLEIAEVSGGERCTFAEVSHFFSHRRDTAPGRERPAGRMATAIWRS